MHSSCASFLAVFSQHFITALTFQNVVCSRVKFPKEKHFKLPGLYCASILNLATTFEIMWYIKILHELFYIWLLFYCGYLFVRPNNVIDCIFSLAYLLFCQHYYLLREAHKCSARQCFSTNVLLLFSSIFNH